LRILCQPGHGENNYFGIDQKQEKEMELVNYDTQAKEYTIKMSEQDYLDTVKFAQEVYATADRQDLTALGVYTKQRVMEVINSLKNQNPPTHGEYVLRLAQQDFLDTLDMVDVEALYYFSVPELTNERVRELNRSFYNVLRKDLGKPPV
jgi:hypothetical protein